MHLQHLREKDEEYTRRTARGSYAAARTRKLEAKADLSVASQAERIPGTSGFQTTATRVIAGTT
jgi:hypothetical protein